MGNVNKFHLVGRLGADPETKTFQGGSVTTKLSVGTTEHWVDKEGKKCEETDWFKVVVWGKLAEICAKHLSKGREVYVEGKLKNRSWEGEDGKKRYSTEVVSNNVQFLGTKPAGSGGQGAPAGYGGNFAPEPSFDTSEEIPF